MVGSSQLLHPCLDLNPAAGKQRVIFVFHAVCCLWLFKLWALQAFYLCTTPTIRRAQGWSRPLAANITQIIIELIGNRQFFVLSFPFLLDQVTISLKTVFRLSSCQFCIAQCEQYGLSCLQEPGGDSTYDKSIC